MPAKKLTAVVIDDERLARRGLELLLEKHPEVQIIGQACDVESGVKLLRAVQPDLVFLDVQMPDGSGFDLLQQVAVTARIVFVTAYDTFALRAFEVNALDYLLKPVNPQRLRQVLQKVEAGREAGRKAAQTLELDDYLFLTIGNHQRFLRVDQIELIEAAGDYSDVHTIDGQSGMVLLTLSAWEKRLPSKAFVRIHRSRIVNLKHLSTVEAWFNRAYRVHFRTGREPVLMSRRCAARLRDRFS